MEDNKILSRLSGDFKAFALLVGIEAALKTVRAFGGCYLPVPKLSFVLREERDRQIRASYDQGEPVKKIAIKHGLTCRRVYDILKRSSG